MDSETIDKRKHKGGHIIRYSPTRVQDIMASPFLKKSFQDAGCLAYCQKIEEFGFSDKLIRTFATSLRRDKVTIVGVVFTL